MPTHNSATLSIENSVGVSRQEFVSRLLRAQTKVALSGKGSLRFIVANRPPDSLLIFADPVKPVYVFNAGLTFHAEPGDCEYEVNAEQAQEALLELVWHVAPQETTAAFDKAANALLQDIFLGKAEVIDAIWLIRWIKFRAKVPRLDFDEAQRLFASTPKMDLSGNGPIVSWEELGALIGPDAGFEQRKRLMQHIFEEDLNNALEEYAAGMNNGFMLAWYGRMTDSKK